MVESEEVTVAQLDEWEVQHMKSLQEPLETELNTAQVLLAVPKLIAEVRRLREMLFDELGEDGIAECESIDERA